MEKLILLTVLILASYVATETVSENEGYFYWGPEDVSTNWSTFQATRLPERSNGEVDLKDMPVLGNGRLSFVPFSKTIHMANFFNGREKRSHLAHIPAMGAFDIDFENMEFEDKEEKFTLNVEKGYFEKRIEISRFKLSASLKIYTCAESASRGLIVHQISMNRGTYKGGIYLTPTLLGSESSTDLRLERIRIGMRRMKVMASLTEPESPRNQGQSHDLYMYYTYPRSVGLRSDEETLTVNFVMAIAKTDDAAKSHYQFAKELDAERLFSLHTNAWQMFWRRANIEIEGNTHLAKLTASAMYSMMTSLPESMPMDDSKRGSSVAANGISNGANMSFSNGHVTSQTEKWLFPIALIFYPEKAKTMLKYRSERLESAEQLARRYGWKGAKYPWESTETGNDVTTSACELCQGISQCQACSDVIRYGDHVGADIAYAARQFLSMSRDRSWLTRDQGMRMLRGIAEYYASRAEFNPSITAYEIKGVMGPDIYRSRSGRSKFVSNSLYTNMGAAVAIETANYAACLGGASPQSVPHAWLSVARNLYYPINDKEGYFLPYDGYLGEKIVFPSPITADYFLSHTLSRSVTRLLRENNLKRYLDKIHDEASGSAWSGVVEAMLDVGNRTGADHYFRYVYESFTRKPFWVWTNTRNHITWSTSNHLPTMAAFLQTLVFGYSGLKITANNLLFNPYTPPNTDRIRFNGIQYKGATFDLSVTRGSDDTGPEHATIIMTDNPIEGDFVLKWNDGMEQVTLQLGIEKTIPRQRFTLHWIDHTSQACDPPRDPAIQFHPLTTHTTRDSSNYARSAGASRVPCISGLWLTLTAFLRHFLT